MQILIQFLVFGFQIDIFKHKFGWFFILKVKMLLQIISKQFLKGHFPADEQFPENIYLTDTYPIRHFLDRTHSRTDKSLIDYFSDWSFPPNFILFCFLIFFVFINLLSYLKSKDNFDFLKNQRYQKSF